MRYKEKRCTYAGIRLCCRLFRWEHLPVALAPDAHGMIFSGRAVVDLLDTSGLFGGGILLDSDMWSEEQLTGDAYEIEAVFEPLGAGEFGFRIRRSGDGAEETVIGYVPAESQLFVDRTVPAKPASARPSPFATAPSSGRRRTGRCGFASSSTGAPSRRSGETARRR